MSRSTLLKLPLMLTVALVVPWGGGCSQIPLMKPPMMADFKAGRPVSGLFHGVTYRYENRRLWKIIRRSSPRVCRARITRKPVIRLSHCRGGDLEEVVYYLYSYGPLSDSRNAEVLAVQVLPKKVVGLEWRAALKKLGIVPGPLAGGVQSTVGFGPYAYRTSWPNVYAMVDPKSKRLVGLLRNKKWRRLLLFDEMQVALDALERGQGGNHLKSYLSQFSYLAREKNPRAQQLFRRWLLLTFRQRHDAWGRLVRKKHRWKWKKKIRRARYWIDRILGFMGTISRRHKALIPAFQRARHTSLVRVFRRRPVSLWAAERIGAKAAPSPKQKQERKP